MDKISIFILSDDNYVAAAASLMVSILEHTKSEIDFYIIDSGLSILNRRLLEIMRDQYGFRMELMRAVDYRHHLKLPTATRGTIGRATSDKFLVPYMKPDLDRAIILDADMIAQGDIRELWEKDLEDKVIAAVPHYGYTDLKQIYDGVRLAGLSPLHFYFNTGTLLVNLNKWREEQIGQKISGHTITFEPRQTRRWDEVVLNLLFQINNYKILEPKFNMTIAHLLYYRYNRPYEHKRVIEEHLKLSKEYRPVGIKLLHFMLGNSKPWNVRLCYYPPMKLTSEIPFFKAFWYYLRQTPLYNAESISFLDKRVEIMEARIRKDNKDRINNLLSYNKITQDYHRNKMLTWLTLGLVRTFSQKAKVCRRELQKIEKSFGL